MQSRIDQLEANIEELGSAERARRFMMSIGIMQMQDAVASSPNQTEKGKAKNVEEAVSLLVHILILICFAVYLTLRGTLLHK